MNAPLPALPKFQPKDPAFAARVRASFARQKAMVLIGATLTVVEPGYTEIALPYRADLTQQKAFVHGGILGMIADSPATTPPLAHASDALPAVITRSTSAPARSDLVARGQVIRPGRTLAIARGDVYAADGTHVASMLQTLMMLADTPDTPDEAK
jgi:uncharacterized protein (TIGR00369 family)